MRDATESLVNQVVAMLPALRAAEKRLDRETGRQFSVFDLFYTDEPATSRFLALLLDPRATHGQGDVFLRLFIRRFVPEWDDIFSYNEAKSAATDERIDVTISDGERWLGIENKIFYAPEQKTQTDRYLDELKRRSGQTQKGDYCFVYLSPRGEPPSSYSFTPEGKKKHDKKLILGAWAQTDAEVEDQNDKDAQDTKAEGIEESAAPIANMMGWLSECENECRADNVRWFLRQFRTLVYRRLIGESEYHMAGDAIIELALRSMNNLDAALRIGEQCQNIRKNVAASVLSSVCAGLEQWVQHESEDWELKSRWPGGDWIASPALKYLPLLLRRKRWPDMVGIAIQADRVGPNEVFIGIMSPTQDTWDGDRNSVSYYGNHRQFIDESTRQALAKAVKLETPQWSWWVFSEKLTDADGQDISNWEEVETVKRLYDKRTEIARHIVERMIRLARIVDGTPELRFEIFSKNG